MIESACTGVRVVAVVRLGNTLIPVTTPYGTVALVQVAVHQVFALPAILLDSRATVWIKRSACKIAGFHAEVAAWAGMESYARKVGAIATGAADDAVDAIRPGAGRGTIVFPARCGRGGLKVIATRKNIPAGQVAVRTMVRRNRTRTVNLAATRAQVTEPDRVVAQRCLRHVGRLIAVKLKLVERMAVAVSVVHPLHVGQTGWHRNAFVFNPPRLVVVAFDLVTTPLQGGAVRRVVWIAALWPEGRVATIDNERIVDGGVDVRLLFECQPDDVADLVAAATARGTFTDVTDSAWWATSVGRVHGFHS